MQRKIISLPAAITCTVFVILSVVLWLWMQNSSADGQTVSIYKGGDKMVTLPLNEDDVYNLEDVEMTVEIKDGAAFISQSDCRCKTCIGFGKLSKKGQSAVCLPNRVSIQIDGNGEVDAVL